MSLVTTPRRSIAVAQRPAERQQQRRLAAAHRTANADGEGPLLVVARQRLAALLKATGMVERLVPMVVAVVVAVVVSVVRSAPMVSGAGMGMRHAVLLRRV
jgi:hypothetical protein